MFSDLYKTKLNLLNKLIRRKFNFTGALSPWNEGTVSLSMGSDVIKKENISELAELIRPLSDVKINDIDVGGGYLDLHFTNWNNGMDLWKQVQWVLDKGDISGSSSSKVGSTATSAASKASASKASTKAASKSTITSSASSGASSAAAANGGGALSGSGADVLTGKVGPATTNLRTHLWSFIKAPFSKFLIGTTAGYFGVKAAFGIVDAARKSADIASSMVEQSRSLEFGGTIGAGFKSQAAATERKRALQQSQKSPMSGRRNMTKEAENYAAQV